MNRAGIIVGTMVVVFAVLGTGLYYYVRSFSFSTTPSTTQAAAVIVPERLEEERVVREQVFGFGEALKKVSVQAPATELANEMRASYGAYVTSQLISHWVLDPSSALGREVSSPWPDHIEITSVIKQGDGTYVVEGMIVEATSTDTSGTPAARYPVSLILTPTQTTWLISSASVGPREYAKG